MRPTLIAVTGPTATGKTDLAIKLACLFNTSVINCDSRQFYKEMSIGTAKPTAIQLAQAPHHFIDFLSITDTYTVGDFESDAVNLAGTLVESHRVVVACGGSGLFIKALMEGLGDALPSNVDIRSKWERILAEKGLSYLQDQTRLRDPVYYAAVDILNPRRLQRALEIMEITGLPLSEIRTGKAADRPFDSIYIGLNDANRTQLYSRINLRVEKMVADGLEEEVRTLLPYKACPAFNTIGYTEWLPYLEGNQSKSEVIEAIKQNSRHYAKRQITWFNKVPGMHWFEPQSDDEIIQYIRAALSI